MKTSTLEKIQSLYDVFKSNEIKLEKKRKVLFFTRTISLGRIYITDFKEKSYWKIEHFYRGEFSEEYHAVDICKKTGALRADKYDSGAYNKAINIWPIKNFDHNFDEIDKIKEVIASLIDFCYEQTFCQVECKRV